MAASSVMRSERAPDDAEALFANAAWRVAPEGLEHRATGYFIERDALGARRPDGHWEWPLHLGEKGWCSVALFREAFLAALRAFDVATDDALAFSFAAMRAAREEGADGRFVRLGELSRAVVAGS